MMKLTYEQLPVPAQHLVAKQEFLRAYTSDAVDTVIVWVKDASSGRQREQEFSSSKEAFLTRSERQQRFPPPEVLFVQEDLLVEVTNSLEEGTDVRYEVYKIYRSETHVLVTSAKQMYYGPFRKAVVEVVKSAVAEHLFPSEYARWSEEQRVNYWVGRIYRMRRQAGESAGTEDAALDLRLGSEMRWLDPDIERILPLILTSLAHMEQIEPRALARVFGERTGLHVA